MSDAERIKKLDRWRSAPLLIAFLFAGILNSPKFFSTAFSYVDSKGFGLESSLLNIVFWGGLYVISFMIFLKSPITGLYAIKRNILIFLLIIFVAFSALWSVFQTRALINSTHIIGCSLIALIATLRYAKEPSIFVLHASIFLGINQIIHLISIIFLHNDIVQISGRWMGLTSHPNTLGSFAFLTLWANTSVLINKIYWRKMIHFLFLTAALINLIKSNSITSIFISLLSIGSVFIFYWIQSKYSWNKGKYIIYYLAICFVVMVVYIISYEEFVRFLLTIVDREKHLTGRIYIWKDALNLIIEKPFIGYGNGGASQTNELAEIATYFHPHNGYYDLLIKGGFISIFLFLAVIYRLVKNINRLANWDIFTVSLLTPVIFSIIIQNFTEANILGCRNIVWFILLVCIFLLEIRKSYPFRGSAARLSH